MCFNNIMLLRTVTYLVAIQLISAKEQSISECVNYDTVSCGDSRGIYQWEFCGIRYPHQRITQISLDRRFKTCYCGKNNFGITTNRRRFWVHQWCFGTFKVCYVSEEEYQKSVEPPPDIDNNSDGDRSRIKDDVSQKVTQDVKSTSTSRSSTSDLGHDFTRTPSIPIKILASDNIVTKTAFTRTSPTESLRAPATQNTISSNAVSTTYGDTSNDTSNASSPEILENPLSTQQTAKNSLKGITANAWKISIVGAAGGLLLVLIGLIFFLAYKRCSVEPGVKDRRYSEEDTSTTHLGEPISGTNQEKSVYDFIPIDPETGYPSVSETNQEPCKCYLYEKTDIIKDNVKLNIYDRASIGNEYDVLNTRSKPCRSISETSTYSHLGDITLTSAVTDKSETNHVYAILMPVDSEHFGIMEEGNNDPHG